MKPIKYFDMFAGAGGFRSGLSMLGDFFMPVGWCEIDKYAQRAYRALYDTRGEYFCDDARQINPDEMPDIDLICGGFPCQPFSIANCRNYGFDDPRGTLFFEIARIAAAKRPAYLLLENVPNLLSHDSCRTFATILNALSELGYDVAWQVLNSKDFGVPQSRKRVYIVGYLRERCAGTVFSFNETNGASPVQAVPGRQSERIYLPTGTAVNLTSNYGGFGGKTGLYNVSLPIKVKTEKGYQLAFPGDSIDLAYPNINTRRGRVGSQIAHTVTPSATQGYFFIDMNSPPNLTEYARCLTTRQDSGISNHKGEKSGVFVEDEPRAILTPEKDEVRQNGRRIKEPNEPMFTLTVCDKHGVIHNGRVRRLMPIECFRLQGYTDEQFAKLVAEGIPETQLYKLAGNSVTTNVVAAVGRKLMEDIMWSEVSA